MSTSWSSWHTETHDEKAKARGIGVHKLLSKIFHGHISLDTLDPRVSHSKFTVRGFDPLRDLLEFLCFKYRLNGGGVEEFFRTNRGWEPALWDTLPWLKSRIDLWINNFPYENTALLVDFKTGTDLNAEIDRAQVRFYSAILFAHKENVRRIAPLLIYLDLGKTFPEDGDIQTLDREDLIEDRILAENRKR